MAVVSVINVIPIKTIIQYKKTGLTYFISAKPMKKQMMIGIRLTKCILHVSKFLHFRIFPDTGTNSHNNRF